MGGGFGGKETQAAPLPAWPRCSPITRRPVKLRLDRDDDMLLTGKRHDFQIDYEVGFDDEGRIQGTPVRAGGGLRLLTRSVGGDCRSGDVPRRQRLFAAARAHPSHRCKTHTVSNTAFRGFGGPPGHDGHREK